MKDASAPKYMQAEQHDRDRLEARGAKSEKARLDVHREPKPPPAHADAPAEDVGLEATAADAADEPISAEEGIDLEDTSFLQQTGDSIDTHDNDMQSTDHADTVEQDASNDMHDDSGPAIDSDAAMETGMNMVALMDLLQSLDVEPVAANRFAAAVIRADPTLAELYGRGSIADLANKKRRDLIVLGK